MNIQFHSKRTDFCGLSLTLVVLMSITKGHNELLLILIKLLSEG